MLSLAEHLQKESFAQGVQQGVQQGIRQGIQRGERRMLLSMLKKGKTVEEISDLTDQPLGIIQELIELVDQ